jgi:hypothetical protein
LVPELTHSAGIKLNNRVSLQRRPERLVIIHRTISPPKGLTRKAVRRICPRLAVLFDRGSCSGLSK